MNQLTKPIQTDNAHTKIKPFEQSMKKLLKTARLEYGLSMMEAAERLGVNRKQLEDFETFRNYGCHVDLAWLLKAAIAYGIKIEIADDYFLIYPKDGGPVRKSMELLNRHTMWD